MFTKNMYCKEMSIYFFRLFIFTATLTITADYRANPLQTYNAKPAVERVSNLSQTYWLIYYSNV